VPELRPAVEREARLAIGAGRIELPPWSFVWLTGT